jgi:alcohol dehydrogenase
MYLANTYRNLLALVRAGRLDPAMITPKTYRLEELPAAMMAAVDAGNLAAVVVNP